MKVVLPTAEDLEKKLQQTRLQLDVLKMISDELSTELDLDKLLDLVAVKARGLIDAESMVVPIINSDRKSYTYRAASGMNAGEIIAMKFPVSVGMCGWVLSKKQPLIFGKDLPWMMDRKTRWEEGMESALLVPLIARGEIVGGLSGLGKKGGGSFTSDDMDLLKIFASQVGIAIDNARIFREMTDEKELSETTLNSIGDAVVVTDVEERVLSANPVACKLLNITQQDMMGQPLKSIFQIYSLNTDKPAADPVEQVLQDGKGFSIGEYQELRSSSGNILPISINVSPIYHDGQLEGVVLVFRDVSVENALIDEVRINERKYRYLIEHLGDEFFMYSQSVSGKLTYVSPTISNCLGYSQQDFITNCSNYLSDTKIDEAFQQALAGKTPLPYEVEALNSSGEKCKLRISKNPVIDENGDVIAIEGLVQDVTKLKAFEESVRHSQKLEAIGRLSGGIAHDFNNQLGVIQGYLEMLRDNLPESEIYKRWIDTSMKSTERCIELTRSLVDFSRQRLSSQSIINVNECLESMLSILEHTLTSSIDFHLQLTDAMTNVIADKGEFQDAILNLVINSRDAMPTGGRLDITTEVIRLEAAKRCFINQLSQGRYVRIQVKDAGHGIEKTIFERIFEPFFTTKPMGQGTGLGMAMVFGFINRVNGGIDLDSELGEGTKIELYIPQVRKSSVLKVSDSHSDDLPTGNERILLVEDEPALRELAATYLESLGYKVTAAEDGVKALDVLSKSGQFDMLFSDVVMPGGMDGFELAYQVRQQLPDIKVLMATGYASRKAREDSEADHHDEMLYKPYSRSILAQRVRRVLDNKNDESITG